MICVVIPCYKVRKSILDVINKIPEIVGKIIVVDDFCPEGTGKYVQENCSDGRVEIISHVRNQGVGGAMISGYKRAIELGVSVVVKIDGDGQMNPAHIEELLFPINSKEADYVKGSRFYFVNDLKNMPFVRLIGNSILSFYNKLISGYWDIMDPTNGYTAIHTDILKMLPLDKISHDFFFESDMLFRLNTIRAVVKEVPVPVTYDNNKSNLSVFKVLFTFPFKYSSRLIKRIIYNYFIRDFNIGTLELLISLIFTVVGASFGIFHWWKSILYGVPATAGTVIISALLIILGFQSFLAYIHFDLLNIPRKVLLKSRLIHE
jgi:dolichol-phosphate mannosyltransferase